MKDFYGMRGNSTIMLGALGNNKASVCVSKEFDEKNTAEISKIGNITYENNLVAYKLRILFAMLAFCMTMVFGGKAFAQETLTVYDGEGTNSNVPVHGLWADAYLKCEFVIPADQLDDMINGTLSEMTFYLTSPASAAWTGTFQVFLNEVGESSISAFYGTDGATTVYTGTLDGTSSTMSIAFSDNYVYNGGNLLVGVYQTASGNYKSATFAGETVTGACVQGYSSSSLDAVSGSQRNFIPKTTFTYTPGAVSTCSRPTELAKSNLTARTVDLAWTNGADETAWQICINGDEDNLVDVTTNPYTLTSLNPETPYSVKVRANCGSEKSYWSNTVSFTTLPSCPVPTEIVCTGFTVTTATFSWTAGASEGEWNLQYKAATDADWTVVNDVTSPYTITGLTEETNYLVQVQAVCNVDDLSAWTSPVQVYTGYCQPAPTSRDGKGITGVSFGIGDDVVNNSDVNGLPEDAPYYGNYASMVGAVQAGVEATVSITYATGYDYGTIVWIDLNNNLTFEGNEVVYVGTSASANPTILNAKFTLPASTPIGDYRMRIAGADSYYNSNTGSIADAADANSCPTSTYTVVHDYTIRVLEAPSCLPPLALRATNIAARTANLVWIPSGSETAWQISISNAPGHEDIIDVTTNPYTLTNLTPSRVHTVKVRANCGDTDGVSAWSNSASFTTLEACPAPTALSAILTPGNGTIATLSWTEEGSATDWMLEYGTASDFSNAIPENVTGTPSINLTGLTAETTYYARVKSVCGGIDGESEWSDVISFETTDKIIIGTGNSTNGYLPTYTFYNYSLTQQIYTVAEIGNRAGAIYSVDFYCSGAVTRDLDIYMVATDKETFEGSSDWITATAADLVYSGPVTFAAGAWTTIELDNPYIYGGTHNVAIIVDDNTGSYETAPNFRTFDAASQAIRYYNDNDNQDPTAPTATGTNMNVKNQIRLFIGEPPACAKPTELTVTDIAIYNATFDWTAGGAEPDWNISYKADGDPDWTEVSHVSNHYTIYDFLPATRYELRVQANCPGGISVSDWSRAITFTTLPTCPIPTNLAVAVTETSATVTWTPGYSETNWNLRYKLAGAAWTNVSDVESPYTITGLTADTHYEVQVQADCGSENSNWSGSYSFFTGYCQPNPTSIDNDGITNVTFGFGDNVVNNSEQLTTAPFYGNYSNLVGDVPVGIEATIGITYETHFDYGTIIWIDFNNNFVFDGDEVVYAGESSSVSPTTLNATFTLPETTPLGEYRMRIAGADTYYDNYTSSIAEAADANSCPTGTFIIIHDYTIRVIETPSCMSPTDVVATSTTTTTATVSWTENSPTPATNWVLQYSTNSDFSDSQTAEVSTNPAEITSLNDGTVYYVRVRAKCDVDNLSYWSNPASFVTECGYFTVDENHRYTEDFAGLTSVTFPRICWSQERTSEGTGYGSSYSEGAWTCYTSTQGTGSNPPMAQLRKSKDGSIHNLVTKALTMAAGNYVVSLRVYRNATSINYQEGINVYLSKTDDLVSDGNDALDLGFISRSYNTASVINSEILGTELATGWYYYDIPVTVGADGVYYVIFEGKCLNGDAIYMDDVVVMVAPTCPKPTDIIVTSTGTNEATIEWTAGGTETSWNLRYKTSNENSWTTINNITNPYTTITNLSAATSYVFQVQADCGGDYSDWTVSETFKTKYGIVFLEEFGTVMPNDWNQYSVKLSEVMNGSPLISANSGWSFGESNGVFGNHARVNIYGGTCYRWLTTPIIVMKPNVQLTFNLALTKFSGTLAPAVTGALDDKFVVLISTDEGATWTVLRQYDNVGSQYVYDDIALEGEDVAIDLTSYSNDEVIIAFYGESTEYNVDNNLHIDNVMLDYIPTCFKPTGLTVVSTDLNTATIEWTPSGDETRWQYSLNGSAWTDFENVTGTTPKTAIISGLTEATVYSIEVRAYCSDNFNDQSRPSLPVSFYTDLCAVGDMCEINYILNDSEGNGWEGNAIKVVDDLTNIVLDTWAVADGESSATGSLSVCEGREIRFEWANGSSSSDCSYLVYDINGDEIFSGEDAMENAVSHIVDCTPLSCRRPRNLVVSNITANSAQISWEPNITISNIRTWQYSIDNGANWVDVSSESHANLTGLTESETYTVQVRTKCNIDEYSDPITASFVTGDMCEIRFELTDSYGDSWNGAAIRVTDDVTGEVLGTLTNLNLNGSSGSGENEVNIIYFPVRDGAEIAFNWISGNFDNETSYVVYDVNDDVIFSGSGAMPYPVTFTVNCPDCVRPNNLIATGVTTTGALLSWDAGSANHWIVEYSTHSDFSAGIVSEDVYVTPEKEYTGLVTDITYYFRVKAVCGVGEESDWSNVCEVIPSVCRRVGNGAAGNGELPSNTYYNYSFTQQIYSAAEIGPAGLMNGISFYNSGAARTRSLDVYVVYTSKTSFSGASDWITVTPEDMVFSGIITMASGQWTQIDFNDDHAIEYDGARNIAVIIDDNTGTYENTMSCLVFNAAGNQTLSLYSDGINYDPMNTSSYAGRLLSEKNQIRFCVESCEDRPGNIAFVNPSVRISVDGSVDLSSDTYFTNTTTVAGTTVQWSSNDPRIATVDSDGVVTAHSAGRAVITASLPSKTVGQTLYCAMQTEVAVIVDCNTMTPQCFDFDEYTGANREYHLDAGLPSCWRRIYTGKYEGGEPHAYKGYFAKDSVAIEITSGNYQLYGENFGYTNYVIMPYISGLENGGMVTFNAWWQYVDFGTLTLGYMTDPDDAATFVAVDDATPFLYNFGSAASGVNQISLPDNMPADAYIAFRWFCQTDYFSYSVAIDNVCVCSAVTGTFELTTVTGNALEGDQMKEGTTVVSIRDYLNTDIDLSTGNLTYSSLNPSIAIVDNDGVVTGTSVGEATIMVTFTPNEDGKCPRYAYFVVTVESESCKEIGDAISTTYTVPVNNNYNYTYTQILFKHDEINASGLITSISFQYANNSQMNAKNSVKLYLKEVNKNEFSNASDWILDVTESDLVYSGALNCAEGWNSFSFDEPFAYSGDKNLLLVIDDNSANSDGENYTFNYTPTSYRSVISYYSNSGNYGNTNISGHSRVCDTNRPNTKFCIYEGAACTIEYNTASTCTGVSNTIASSHGVTGHPIFVTNDIPSCSKGVFLNWNTEPDNSGTSYAPGDFISQGSNMTLYAIYRICDYVDIVKAGNATQGIADGGVDRFGIQKFNVCQGETIVLEAQKKAGAPDNITFSWDVNRHDGHAHVTSETNSVSYVANTTMGHDILLTVDDGHYCKQEIPLRVWVSHGLRMALDNPSAGDICVGNGKEIVVGDPRFVDEPMIVVNNESLQIKSTQGVTSPKFIPDGVGECYTSDVTFADFKENAVITDASNIDYVKINLEHSHIGDVQISLKCYTPNYQPRTAILLQDAKGTSGGGLDNATYDWPYNVIRCYANFYRYRNPGYANGTCSQGTYDGQVTMRVFVGYDNTATGIRQEAKAFDRGMTTREMLAQLQAMINSGNRPADFCYGGYYYKFASWQNITYREGNNSTGGYGNSTRQWYTEAASLGFGKPNMHDGLDNYISTPSYNPTGVGFDYCWSNSDTYQYASAEGSLIDNSNHERGYTNALIVTPSNATNGTQFYHPYQSFQSLVGCKLNGVWTIQICDSWGLDNGYIFSWEIGLKDIDDNAWSYDIQLVDSHVGSCGGFDSSDADNSENLVSEIDNEPNFFIHPTIANLASNNITLPTYPESLTRSCELTLIDNIGCETSANAFTYNISQPAIPNISEPIICLGEQAHVVASLGGPEVASGDESIFKWWTMPEGESNWTALTGQGVANPVNGVTRTEFFYTPTHAGDRFRAEIYDAHGCGGIIDNIITINLPDIPNAADYDYIWHGKHVDVESNVWNIVENWYVNNGGSYSVASASLPTKDDNVYIGVNQCSPNPNLTLSENAVAGNLTIGSGAALTIPAGKTLSIAGNLENIGTLNANEIVGNRNSTVSFIGSDDQSITNAQTFANVSFNQESVHKITADNGITINRDASFTMGILTGDATFNDGSRVTTVNMTHNSYIDGTVVKKGDSDKFTFPTGNDGVLGAFSATIENNIPEGVSVKFNHKNGDGTDQTGFSTEAPDYYPTWWSAGAMCGENDPQLDHVSNFEYWKVYGVNEGVVLTDLTLKVDADHPTQHFHDGVSDYSSNHIVAAAHYDCWKNLGTVSTTVTGTHNTITIRNIQTIPHTRSGAFDGYVTLGSIDRATLLPIELKSLSANCDGKSVLVEWTTASERNNDYFSIERSDDAINFVEVARVAGAGNSIETHNYSYTDYGVHGGDNYYRLVQVDYDGMRSVSEIVVAFCFDDNGEEPEVMAYPNPFNNELTIELENFGNRPARIDVFDMLGKLVYTESVDEPQNSYSTLLQFGELPPSTYNVRVSTSDFVINRKVVKN